MVVGWLRLRAMRKGEKVLTIQLVLAQKLSNLSNKSSRFSISEAAVCLFSSSKEETQVPLTDGTDTPV